MKKKAIIIAALLGVATIGATPVLAATAATETAPVTAKDVLRKLAKAAGVSEPLTDEQFASLVPPREGKGAKDLYALLLRQLGLQANTLDALLASAGNNTPVSNLLVATAAVEFKTKKPVDTTVLAKNLGLTNFDFERFLLLPANDNAFRALTTGVTPTKP